MAKRKRKASRGFGETFKAITLNGRSPVVVDYQQWIAQMHEIGVPDADVFSFIILMSFFRGISSMTGLFLAYPVDQVIDWAQADLKSIDREFNVRTEPDRSREVHSTIRHAEVPFPHDSVLGPDSRAWIDLRKQCGMPDHRAEAEFEPYICCAIFLVRLIEKAIEEGRLPSLMNALRADINAVVGIAKDIVDDFERRN